MKHRNNKGATTLATETKSDASTSFVFGQQGEGEPSHISETSMDEKPIDMSVRDAQGDSEDCTFPTDNLLMTSCDPQGDDETTVAETIIDGCKC